MVVIDWFFDLRLCMQCGLFDSLFRSGSRLLHIFNIFSQYYLFVVLVCLFMGMLIFFLLDYLYLIFFIAYRICCRDVYDFFMRSWQNNYLLSLFLLLLSFNLHFFPYFSPYFQILYLHLQSTLILNGFTHKYLILLR